MSKAAIAFLAGLGGGYINAQDKQTKQQREDEDRAMRKQEFDLRMGEAERIKKDREALAKAGETAAVNEGAVTLNTGDGKPVTYDMPDAAGVAGSDARQFSRNQAATMAPMAASMGTGDVAAPPAVRPAIQSTFAVRGVGYGSKEEAQKAATAYNAPDAVNKRIADAYRATGRPAEALQTEASAKQGKLTDIQLTQAQAAQAHDQAFREITEAFSRNGWSAVPKIYENYQDGKTAKVVEDGKGGAVVNIFDASGKQVGQKAFASEMDFITGAVAKVDPKLWVSMKAKESKDASEVEKNRAIAKYYGAAADAKDAGPAKAPIWDDKADSFLKERYTTKRPETGEALVDGEGMQFAKKVGVAQAGQNGGDATSGLGYAFDVDNRLKQKAGGDPKKLSELRKGYLNALASQPTAPSGAPETKVAPAAQQARDQDRLAILNSELAQAQDRLAKGEPRAQGDIDALNREIASTQKGAPAAAASRKVQAPAPAPVAAAPATSVATGAGALLNPMESAGVQLDRARAQLDALLKGQRPGLAAGRAAMDAYAAKVQAAKQLVAQSEAKYQRLLPQQGAAFVRPSIQ